MITAKAIMRACAAGLIGLAASAAMAGDCPVGTLPTIPDTFTPSGTVGAAGWHTAMDGNLVAVGDPYFARSAGGEGAVHLFRRAGTGWVREALIGASTGEDLRVWGVVGLGDQTAVIARRSSPFLAVYERSEPTPGVGAWTRLGTLGPLYGLTFAVEGTTLVASKNAGGFDVLTRDRAATSGYRVVGSLPPASGPVWRGSPIAIGTDRIAVSFRGGVDVYTRGAGGSWAKTQTITAPAGSPAGWRFALGMDMDGTTLAAGHQVDPETAQGFTAPPGRVQVYTLDAGTGLFVHSQTLTVPGNTAADGLGHSVAVEGDRMAVGASLEDRSGLDSGAIHVFHRVGGSWVYAAPMGVTDSPAAWLGYSVNLEGGEVLAGAIGYAGRGAGVHFDACALPPGPGATPRCLPGVLGLVTFLNAWFGGDAFADYDGSGAVEVLDIFAFLQDWFAGCP